MSILDDLKTAIRAGKTTQGDVIRALFDAQDFERFRPQIEAAQFEADDDTEVDHWALIDTTPGGVWVGAWLWIPNPEPEDEE
jgi:hypothetical protein